VWIARVVSKGETKHCFMEDEEISPSLLDVELQFYSFRKSNTRGKSKQLIHGTLIGLKRKPVNGKSGKKGGGSRLLPYQETIDALPTVTVLGCYDSTFLEENKPLPESVIKDCVDFCSVQDRYLKWLKENPNRIVRDQVQ